MQTESGQTISPWTATVEMPQFPALDHDTNADVCVVGAGIAGLTTAYLLAREGKSVIVIDDGQVGGGETGRTTAHIVNALDDRYYELERLHGEEGSRLAAESHTAAIQKVAEIVAAEKIDCDFQRIDGYLWEPPGGDPKNLDKELEASKRAGLKLEMVDRAPLPFDTGKALKFPAQAQFHALKYLRGLAQAFTNLKGKIYTQTRAEEVKGGNPGRVTTKLGHVITAQAVVVATNTPMNDRVVMHTKQAPYRTYVIGVEIPRDYVPPGLYWDNDDPYHYIRLQRTKEDPVGGDLLIVGGEDHKTGQPPESEETPFMNLIQWTRKHFPRAGEVKFRWSGQVLEPVDSLGFIGHNPVDRNNVYIATGDSGNGMTHGTIAGVLITDLINGRENRWETLYDPSRKSLKALPEFAKENLNVAAQYSDVVRGGEVDDVAKIRENTGAVIRRGLKKVAVYRDGDGKLHERSAVCTHLGCIVHWNDVEKTWDCPCHGSRFDRLGHVLNGPTKKDLKPAE